MIMRRGMTIMEVVVASGLLLAIMTVCLQFLGAAAAQRRAARQRQTAIQEAANAMERLSTRPWDDLRSKPSAYELSPAARALLPAAELAVEVTTPPDEPDARRVVVTVRWDDSAGQPVRPVCLVAWRYRS